MSGEHPMPTGPTSARLHGAKNALLERARKARVAARTADSPEFAASLRGKAIAYAEAAAFLNAIERGRDLPKRRTREPLR